MIQEIVKEGNEKTLVLLGRNVKTSTLPKQRLKELFTLLPPSLSFSLFVFLLLSIFYRVIPKCHLSPDDERPIGSL